ncbi:YhcN/YlaJ family sporulation lipoprotein [Paenibacillus silvisoli]|uniref:YhcN/YlaJ family sporulation lipoprotein n=1 Tax=Paenibacillus silvisoli TaxID=3110539 RepID=UPI0028052CA7|nr:YhcN/YlaJ family sporulation lipoprotein [Paenibacillus silvisoli]
MQRKWAVLAAGAMLTTILTGCMDNQGDLGNRNIRNNSVAYDMNGNRIINTRFANDQMNEMNRANGHRLNSNNIIGLHKNYRLEMSQDIANRLESLPEVNNAYVMLTDNNAYVAVSMKSRADMRGSRAMNVPSAPMPLSRTQQAYQRPYMKAGNTNTRISAISTPNMMRNLAAPTPSPTTTAAPGNLARTNDEVTDALKDRIANEVKQMAPSVKNVYVSANPDFVDRMTSYMNDVKTGHPIQGFVAEFNAMVDRIFPHRAGR